MCRTPLISAVISNASNFCLDLLFMYPFGWGAVGAGLATSAAQYISAIVLVWLLIRQKRLFVRHLRTPPTWAESLPVLQVRPARPADCHGPA